MIVGVPVESSPEERRVALVPAALPTLTKAGLEILLQQGAGEKAGFPRRLRGAGGTSYTRSGSAVLIGRRSPSSAGSGCQRRCWARRSGVDPLWSGSPGTPKSFGSAGSRAEARKAGCHVFRTGAAAAHQPRSVYGCPDGHGHNSGLQGSSAGRRRAEQDVSHDDYRRRNHHPSPGPCGGGRRGRAPDHRLVTPPGRSCAGLRRAAGGQGRGEQPSSLCLNPAIHAATGSSSKR